MYKKAFIFIISLFCALSLIPHFTNVSYAQEKLKIKKVALDPVSGQRILVDSSNHLFSLKIKK